MFIFMWLLAVEVKEVYHGGLNGQKNNVTRYVLQSNDKVAM